MTSLKKQSDKKLFKKFRKFLDDFDTVVLAYIQSRSTLIAAFLAICLIFWGILGQGVILILQVVFSAAFGYCLGFIPGVIFDLLLTFIRLYNVHFQVNAAPFPVLQFFICAYITWLGFRHHQLTKLLKEKLGEFEHPDHVVPWTFVNEVRNSLMAMRLLLFRYTKETTTQADLKIVEEELLRLESLFGALPEGSQDKIKFEQLNKFS